MKPLPLLFGILLGISGCATKPADPPYLLDSASERAATYLRVITIGDAETTDAVISALYLNAAYPQRFREEETFLLAVYDAGGRDVVHGFTLNGTTAPLSVEEVTDAEEWRRLMPPQNRWNRYYLLRFPRQQNAEELILTPGTDRSVQGALRYRKDLQ